MNEGKKRFIILDRDGTIIEDCHYLSDPNKISILPGAFEGLREFSKMGFGLLIVTNQSAIGRGYFDNNRLSLIHDRLLSILKGEGVLIDGIYSCPHTPEDGCQCRKPLTGLIEEAEKRYMIDIVNSFVIGDKPCDIMLGINLGAKTLLVRTGYGEKTEKDTLFSEKPDFIVNDLKEASKVIRDYTLSNLKK